MTNAMTMTEAPVYFLLVDDLKENLLSLEALLKREGLVLLKAQSGTEALELLLKHDVALALLDVQMPVMDGFELAELMRGSVRTNHVPIIFLTAGNADRQRRFRGYEAGAVDFLLKPIETDILRSKAQIFFDLYRQRQQIACQRDKLQEADQRKDEFLATLAHELRNPLAPIQNGLQILMTSNDKKTLSSVGMMMDRQLVHLVRLIDDLLDVSRISQGKIELRKEKLTLQSVLKSAIEVSAPALQTRRHTFETDITPSILWVDGDFTRLTQIIDNLINNAAKYTNEGGLIKLSLKQQGDQAVITVQDNGLGIPEKMQARIFDLFTQVGRNLDHAQGGLGIGLALVKRLVEMHHGSIEAESAGPGTGSAFIMRLPLVVGLAQPETSPQENSPAAVQAETPMNILIVDDNTDSAQTMGWMLEMLGHHYVLAYDGTEALKTARAIKPDAIILDIGLPGISGYEVCTALRSEPAFKDTLIIAQTGWGQDRDKQKALEAGFSHHLTKPVKPGEISALLKKK